MERRTDRADDTRGVTRPLGDRAAGEVADLSQGSETLDDGLRDSRDDEQSELSASRLEAPRITPFLWFDSNAEDAVDFYVSIFRNSRRLDELPNNGDVAGLRARVLTVSFELDGQRLTAMNGGPGHPFTDAFSLVVRCDSQQDIDDYWAKLSAGGSEIQCGWLKDKFGLCWQIVPANLSDLVKHPKAMLAMMNMVKLDVAELERAARS
jgi:predicted 3-demethylubiquinone-9 3-methyltransferase (glyoxalase superfamily)